MSVLGAFCNQLIRFFEELENSYPEEKSISMGLEAIRAAKDMIMNRRAEEVVALAQRVLSTQFNELMPALMIFQKYWPTMSESNREVIWQYLQVLCKLCEKVRA